MSHPLGIILKGYPRLSETFIAQEIYNLQQAGFDIVIFSLRRPTDKRRHELHAKIRARVNYLPEYLYREPWRVIKSWRRARRLPGYAAARRRFIADLRRDISPNRIRRFGQALVLAAELPPQIKKLYAHFLHTPASVAFYAARMQGLPWACSAHAKDIWTSAEWEIAQKLSVCEWLTTCTQSNAAYLQKLSTAPDKVELHYHGLDLELFSRTPPVHSARDGGDPKAPVRMLSVGRAVAKKGYADLLRALAVLPRDLHWQLHHIGGGPLLPKLKKQCKQLQIDSRVVWRGAASRDEVIKACDAADLFVLNSQIDKHGDRDGLPNVLLEAQSRELAAVATGISGIPELLQHEINGLLVAQKNNAELARALQRLIQDPALRRRLGERGGEIVRERFDMRRSFISLKQKLEAM